MRFEVTASACFGTQAGTPTQATSEARLARQGLRPRAFQLAHYVEREIERIYKGMPVVLPVPVGSSPQVPNAKGGGPAQRPAAGPVVPLTETRVAPEELLGGDGATPAAAAGATVTRALTKGEALAAPSGRADDFSWPPLRRSEQSVDVALSIHQRRAELEPNLGVKDRS